MSQYGGLCKPRSWNLCSSCTRSRLPVGVEIIKKNILNWNAYAMGRAPRLLDGIVMVGRSPRATNGVSDVLDSTRSDTDTDAQPMGLRRIHGSMATGGFWGLRNSYLLPKRSMGTNSELRGNRSIGVYGCLYSNYLSIVVRV